jgi:hypothetical protein
MLNRKSSTREVWRKPFLAATLCLVMSVPAGAHIGPPFPIIENKKIGPYTVALWIHPDIGTSAVFVIVDPAPGQTVPNDLKIQIGIQPESGRLPEVVYDTQRDAVQDHVQYDNQVEFDKQEFWRVRLIVQSSLGGGEAVARVEATPTALGRWDLLFYSFPFIFMAFMWYRGISRRRKRAKRSTGSAPASIRGLSSSTPERGVERRNP